ncbi:unnamed protein product [Caenorhabditis auriculariae]|uniref:LysM domain-containing protein n=1 Tax=Caenorhabditis auriculariae TaxID=2777116 RepID=A0A8S1HSN8_9PELO|nr:unnamed protein product [Caenorhabditis auriculariae]
MVPVARNMKSSLDCGTVGPQLASTVKMWRSKAQGMEYTVGGADSLERIAAAHDCTVGELMKLNKMGSRMVFPGQKILVPLPNSDDVFHPPPAAENSTKGSGKLISGSENAADGIRKGPGGAVPAGARGNSLTKTHSAPVSGRSRAASDDVDTDCLQRFLKIKVKQVTESDGTVSGTLLVTPNCLMFDPDVSHPLVKENGPDLYGMVANMDEIVAVSVYKEIGGLTGDTNEKKRDIFDPDHVRTPSDSPQREGGEEPATERSDSVQFYTQNDSDAGGDSGVDEQAEYSSKPASETFLPAITEESNKHDSPVEEKARGEDGRRKRSVTVGEATENASRRRRSPQPSCSQEERPRSFSELDAPTDARGIGRFSPNAARRSFGKLGRTLSARAKSIQGTVAQGAEKMAATAVQGTKTVAHGVVTHTKSAADTLHCGIENGVKVVGEQAKAAADVAGRVVDRGQSLVNDGLNGVTDLFSVDVEENSDERSPMVIKREQSLAKLEDLRQRTNEAREISQKENKNSIFSCATSTDEMPDLFMSVDEIVEKTRSKSEGNAQPMLPFYMAVRLTRMKKRKSQRSSPSSFSSSYEEDINFGNKLKREFWFAIPRSKADHIYHFLLQWTPEKYGLDTTLSSTHNTSDKGFIVLDSKADESLSGPFSLHQFLTGNPRKMNE